MRQHLRLPAFVAAISTFFALMGVVEAQVPTLYPEQTVNLATGQMGFSLPLGTVRGVNGHDFPIDLSYNAGILFNQEASDVGLGFSYGAGAITRKVVSVPDNNNGPYTFQTGSLIVCDETATNFWRKQIISLVYWVPGMGQFLATIQGIRTYTMLVNQYVFGNNNNRQASDYRSRIGKDYDWKENIGKGFFKNGESTDAPDIYIVSTPFISGELVWIGDPANGHFVFKNTQGCALKGEEAVRVDYIYQNGFNNEKFIIKLADGTRLIFKVTDTYNNLSTNRSWHNFLHEGDVCGYRDGAVYQTEASPGTWWLTAVLFSDYVDGGGNIDDPLDLNTINKGSWLAFEYTPRVCQGIYQKKDWDFEVGRSGYYRYFQGGSDCVFQQLTKVKTPVGAAEFVYSAEPRLDDLYEAGKDNFFRRPRLAKILFRSLNGVCYRQIDFKTSYTLRPGSRHSYSSSGECGNVDQGYRDPLEGNPDAACLTLNQIAISDAAQSKPEYINFLYGNNPNVTVFTGQTVPLKPGAQNDGSLQIFIEKKDIWGYYYPNSGTGLNTVNNSNPNGIADNSDKADAWSLKSIALPDGKGIQWDYEPNRYDRVNGEPVTSNEITNAPRYGGGIRVKKITINNGLGKTETISYFYTDQKGQFIEDNTNSSGYTGVEPAGASESSLTNEHRTLGGCYTPSKVSYEMIQVVKNYREANPHAPTGYTVYEFTHAGDRSVNEYYPNEGPYGEFDYSWKRGRPILIEQCDSRGNIIESKKINYEFIEQEIPEIESNTNLFDWKGREARVGWVFPKSEIITGKGVAKTTEYKYAPDRASGEDYKEQEISACTMLEPWLFDMPPSLNYENPDAGGAYTMTKLFGGPSLDHVLALPFISLYNKVQILIAPNISEYECSGNAWRRVEVTWTDPYYRLIGVSVWDYDGNANPEMMLFFAGTVPGNYQTVRCMFLKDVTYNAGAGNWNYTLGGQAQFHFTALASDRQIISCAIGKVTIAGGGGIPGVVFLQGNASNPGQPIARPIYYLTELPYVTSSNTDHYYLGSGSSDIQTTSWYSCPGNRIWLNDAKATPVAIPSSVEITGFQLNDDKVYHTRINSFINFGSSTDRLEDFCSVGSLNTGEGSQEVRYYGMNCYTDVDGIENRYLFFYRPLLAGIDPRLTIAKVWVRDVVCDLDGQPNEVWTTAPNNKYLVTKTIPAYWKYPGMRINEGEEPHMLTQPCQTITYEKSDLTSLSDADVRSAQVTTWGYWLYPVSNWLPKNSYVWNVPKSQAGVPLETFSEFNFITPPSQPNVWQLTGSVEKYDAFSAPLETKNAKGISSTTVYRNDLHLPIASIANANFKECGVFTGDYDQSAQYAGYFDYDNGWEKMPQSSIWGLEKHFCDSVVRVINSYGPTRNFVVSKDKNYVMTAWVKVASGTLMMKAEYRNGSGDMSVWPIPYAQVPDPLYDAEAVTITSAQATNWTLVKLYVNASTKLNAATGYVRAWVGTPGGGVAYIDDIRFHPVKSLVSTTYYDTKWQQPILSVDANNNPGRKVVYDDFGRPVRWYKIDKTNPASMTPVQQKEYHLMSEWYKPDPTKWYKIVYSENEGYCIDIKDRLWADGQMVHLYPILTAGDYNQQWKFEPVTGGYYKIVSRGGSGTDYRLSNPGGTGASLVIRTADDAADAQQWTMTDAGGGYCHIAAKANSTYLIDLDGGNLGDGETGGKVQLWPGGMYSKWKLVEVDNEAQVSNGPLNFYIGKTEVRQAEYQVLMENNPSPTPQDGSHPVSNVTWYDALMYCNARSKAEGFDTVYVYATRTENNNHCIGMTELFAHDERYGYRLPTETEWQAAYYQGSGRTTGYYWPTGEDVGEYAWYYNNSSGGTVTHTVGQLKPNAIGLFDMAGNIAEWVWYTQTAGCGGCEAWYGGAYNDVLINLSGDHFGLETGKDDKRNNVGFRVVRTYHP